MIDYHDAVRQAGKYPVSSPTIEAYSHIDYHTDRLKSREAILRSTAEKGDLFGGSEVVSVDGRPPTNLQKNAARLYPHLLAGER